MQTWTKSSNTSSGGHARAANVSRRIYNQQSGNVNISPQAQNNMMRMPFATSALHFRARPAEPYVRAYSNSREASQKQAGKGWDILSPKQYAENLKKIYIYK